MSEKKRRARGTGQVLKVGDVWKIRYTLNGRRVQETAGSRKQDAVELLNRRLGQAAEGRLTADAARLMWSDLETIILDAHAQHRSYEKVERHVRKHLRRHFAGLRVQALTYDRMLTYKRDRLTEGARPNTVKYELSLVRTGLVVAHKAGRLVALPPMPDIKVENTRTSFFEDWEFRATVEALRNRGAHPSVVAALTFIFWTGWRKMEALSREWRHVDFDRGEIILEAEEKSGNKGYKARVFPFAVLPELAELLRAQRAYTDEVERRTGRVIRAVFHREGKPVIDYDTVFHRAMEDAGVPRKTTHDFRRTAVRRLERAGVPRKVAMELVGHKTEMMYQRYAITKAEDLREGLAKVVASTSDAKGTQAAPIVRRLA